MKVNEHKKPNNYYYACLQSDMKNLLKLLEGEAKKQPKKIYKKHIDTLYRARHRLLEILIFLTGHNQTDIEIAIEEMRWAEEKGE